MSTTQAKVARPRGITLLAIMIALLGVGAGLNALTWPILLRSDAAADGRISVPAGAASPVFITASVVYAITAMVCVRMLWRLNVLAPRAFLVWAIVALASVLALDVNDPGGISTIEFIDREWLVPCIALGLLLLAIWVYIRSAVRQSDKMRSNNSLDGARGGQ